MSGIDPEAVRHAAAAQMERYRAFVQSWDLEVGAAERQSWDAQRIAADFGKLGLQSAVLVNGGALVAIPPLMQWLNENGRHQIASHAVWFLFGLAFAFLSIVVAYVNFSAISTANSHYAVKRGLEMDADYVSKSIKEKPEYISASKKHRAYSTTATATAWIALLLAIASFVFFVLGATGFITLAENDATPVANGTPAIHASPVLPTRPAVETKSIIVPDGRSVVPTGPVPPTQPATNPQ